MIQKRGLLFQRITPTTDDQGQGSDSANEDNRCGRATVTTVIIATKRGGLINCMTLFSALQC